MSTVTHLEQFRGFNPYELVNRPNSKSLDKGTKLRELWSDALATVAIVTLASIVLFEALRVIL